MSSPLSRRELLMQLVGMGVSLPLAGQLFATSPFSERHPKPARPPQQTTLSLEDDAFLNEVEKATFLYFWEQADPKTGMVKDRCNVHTVDTGIVASIAATGFGLSALCIGENRGSIAVADARERVLTALRFLWKKLPNHRGFFYH